jgi:hypothetical protein
MNNDIFSQWSERESFVFVSSIMKQKEYITFFHGRDKGIICNILFVWIFKICIVYSVIFTKPWLEFRIDFSIDNLVK